MSAADYGSGAAVPGVAAMPIHNLDEETRLALEMSRMEQNQANAREDRFRLEMEKAASNSLLQAMKPHAKAADSEEDTEESPHTSNSSIIPTGVEAEPPKPMSPVPPSTRRICGLSTTAFAICTWFFLMVAIVVPLTILLFAGEETVVDQSNRTETIAERLKRYTSLLEEAAPQGISFESDAQQSALDWLAKDEGATNFESQPSNLLERYVAGLMYFAFYSYIPSSSGVHCQPDRTNWASAASICEWGGIECADGQHVTEFRKLFCLIGTIPTEIGFLSHLDEVVLVKSKDLIGTLPSELGQLTALTELRITGNSITGTIPTQLGVLTNLQVLALDENNLSGPIPEELNNLSSAEVTYSGNNLD